MTLRRVDTEGCRGEERRREGQDGAGMHKKPEERQTAGRGGEGEPVKEAMQTERGRESKERLIGEGWTRQGDTIKMEEVGAHIEALPMQTEPSLWRVSCVGALALDQKPKHGRIYCDSLPICRQVFSSAQCSQFKREVTPCVPHISAAVPLYDAVRQNNSRATGSCHEHTP